jgi:hypothetical protein
MKGNMQYKKDVWEVEIRPVNFVEKNEVITPIPIVITRIPNYDIPGKDNPDDYPSGLSSPLFPPKPIPYTAGYTDKLGVNHEVFLFNDGIITPVAPMKLSAWSKRKEIRFRDKYLKIKVRYSGKDLAVISALKTIYTNSYA